MRERKYIKLRVDMYDGTKFKIIDRRPERDLIHHVWNRLVILAGKVNLEGELYMSKNIPYTIETLAIEFNRGIDEVKLALDMLIELEMMELTEDNIYSVKNFTKHQDIKVKEKIKSEDKDDYIKDKEILVEEDFKNQIHDNEGKKSENKRIQSKEENISKDEGKLQIINKDTNKIDDNMRNEKIDDNSKGNSLILLGSKKNKKPNKRKKNDKIEEEIEDDIMQWSGDYDEARPLGEGESITQVWSF